MARRQRGPGPPPPPQPGQHRAKRSLGQNFLVDPNLQRKIVDALQPGPEDEVLEIGPGQGALTRHLAPLVRRLVLVELDDQLAASLQREFAHAPHVEVVHSDILDAPLERISLAPKRGQVEVQFVALAWSPAGAE